MVSGKAVKKDYSNLTINDILANILKYKFIVIICVIIGIAAGVITQIIFTGDDPYIYYYAKATMIVTSKNAEGSYQASGSADNPSASDVSFAQSLVLTVTELAKSNYVLDLVTSKVGDTYLTPDLLSDFISCDAIEKTAFIEVSITWPNESESVQIVNALMDVLPKAMTEKLEIGGVTVVDYAAKTTREYKINAQYALIYSFIGIIIGLCAAVVLGVLNQKVRSEEDITTYLQLNTITEIPFCHNSKSSNCLISDPGVPIDYHESCSVLSSIFQHNAVQKNIKVIYVTSAVSGEGKTTLSINLALSLANKGKDVVLIDCDTRSPAVAEKLGLDGNMSSLQEVLAGNADTKDALICCLDDHLLVMRTDINETPINTDAFNGILATLRECYDYIIIDTPPVGLVSDALVLNSCVDGVLFVIKHDYADMGIIADAVNSVRDSGANILGCVLNAKKKPISNNYYSKSRYYKKYYSDTKKADLAKSKYSPKAFLSEPKEKAGIKELK